MKLLEDLLIFQLLAAPVLPLAFPLLYATIGLILHFIPAQPRRGFFDELQLLLLGMLLSLSAFLAGGGAFDWHALSEWVGGIGLAWGIGRGMSSRFNERMVRGMVFSGVIWIVIGFAQSGAGVPTPSGWLDASQAGWIQVRSYSVFGNPNVYALYLLSIIPMAATLVGVKAEPAWVRAGAAAVLVMIGAALITTYSRSGWLVAVLILGVLLWNLPMDRRWRYGIAGAAGMVLSTSSGVKVRLAGLLTLTDSSTLYRLRIWKGVFRALRDNWVWGVGPGGFGRVYPWFEVGVTPAEHAHSFYWQLWLEYGLIGVIGWLGFLVTMGKVIKSGWNNLWLRGVGLAWLGFWGMGLSESWQDSRFGSGFFWVLTGLILSLRKKEF